jgi:two-component system phosphate regulon sensor histidine kinase PhoR
MEAPHWVRVAGLGAGAAAAAAGVAAIGAHPAWGAGLAAAAAALLWAGAPPAAAVLRPLQDAPAPRRNPAADPGDPMAEPFAGLSRSVLDRLPLGLILIDPAGRIVFQNAAADDVVERRLTGMQAAGALRTPALTEAVAAAVEDMRRTETQLTLLRGAERFVKATVAPIADPSAPQIDPPAAPGDDGDDALPRPYVLIALEDRTSIVKAESLRRDFVANASHELKTPLASISGFIETLQGHAKDDPAATERFLDIMARQTHRMKRLVEDLLSLNRIEINEHVRPRERVDLGGLVWEVASALTPLAVAEGATILVETPREGPMITGSRDELQQVLVNLIDNAIKYGAEGGPIRVHLADPGASHPGMIGVTVADRGPGIPREHIPRLTERFYRVNAARSRERGGTGLGLAIAKHILNRHRGDLTIASTLGEGSRFTIWLPATGDARRAA